MLPDCSSEDGKRSGERAAPRERGRRWRERGQTSRCRCCCCRRCCRCRKLRLQVPAAAKDRPFRSEFLGGGRRSDDREDGGSRCRLRRCRRRRRRCCCRPRPRRRRQQQPPVPGLALLPDELVQGVGPVADVLDDDHQKGVLRGRGEREGVPPGLVGVFFFFLEQQSRKRKVSLFLLFRVLFPRSAKAKKKN